MTTSEEKRLQNRKYQSNTRKKPGYKEHHRAYMALYRRRKKCWMATALLRFANLQFEQMIERMKRKGVYDRMSEITDRINRLERIAANNDDEFMYKFVVKPEGNEFTFYFECAETVDGHIFINGNGPSPEAAIRDAMSMIEGALGAWGFTE